MTSSLAMIDQDTVAEATAAGRFGPAALERRVKEVREHYERICESRPDYIARNVYYYDQVFRLLRFIIPPGERVLQVGCLTPDFLQAVAPSFGVGIDICARQVELASRRFPHLRFQVHEDYDVANLGTFDHVIITDINDQADPIASLRALTSVMNAVIDALADRGVHHLDMPLTPYQIWQALKSAQVEPESTRAQ